MSQCAALGSRLLRLRYTPRSGPASLANGDYTNSGQGFLDNFTDIITAIWALEETIGMVVEMQFER